MASDPFYQTREWKALRRACLARDNHKCVCGARATIADHVVSRRRGGLDTLGNLRSLCATCDSRIKEDADGNRRNGGRLGVIGSQGWPVA